MNELLIRSFTPDIEIRSGGDGRTVEGIVVPFGVAQYIDQSLTEQFASGAFDHQASAVSRIKFTRGHQSQGGVIIGRALAMGNDAAGLRMSFRISETVAGDETLALIKDGVLTDLSVGFRDSRHRRLPNGVIERTRADLFEVSSVSEGAYGESAQVLSVRNQGSRTNLDAASRIISAWPVLSPR